MDRITNDPNLVVEHMLGGWLAAHPELAALPDNTRVVHRARGPQPGRVGVVTGGGSGHEPAFLGYVGEGLLDAVAVGEIFSSPTARSFHDAMCAADGGAGVACLYGNYAGDNMNVRMALQMADQHGLKVRTVVANDDVPSAPRGEEAKRRGVAGEILMWKVACAAADQGASLDEVIAVAQKAIDRTRSIGIGLSACIIPAVGKANFSIAPGTMELGIGHHGEPGIDVRPTENAADMAETMLGTVLPDLPFVSGNRVAVVLSGLGATPIMELYLLYGEIEKRLTGQGIQIAFCRVGNLFTSLEMKGVTLTLMQLDDELEAYVGRPCASVGLTVAGTPTETRFAASVAADGASAPATTAATATRTRETAAGAAPRTVQGASVALGATGDVVRGLIATIRQNRDALSEIDGAIGDGDHGVNMDKGFTGCGVRLDQLGARSASLPAALEQLSLALMDDIGGSMGPLYGSFFAGMAHTLAPHERLDARLFGEALGNGVAAVQQIGDARVGDKTLIDTLVPAQTAYGAALKRGAPFSDALQALRDAAQAGKESTRDMQARIGRAARLGARSIGVLDAGATSCWLLLDAMAESLRGHLAQESRTA